MPASAHALKSLCVAALDGLGKAWALPVTFIGLCYGGAGYLLRDGRASSPLRVRLGHNAIEFLNHPGIRSGCALTLGNVILYGVHADPRACGAYGDAEVCLGRHEQAHTLQYQVLGVFMLLVYPLLHRRGARHNPLERAAQRFGAGRGSWFWQAGGK